MPRAAKNILILDDDLGFAIWLARVLYEAGFVVMPATTAEEALAIVEGASSARVDLLIGNFAIPGITKLLEVLVSRAADLKLMGIGDARLPNGARMNPRLERPEGRTTPSAPDYVANVARVFELKRGGHG